MEAASLYKTAESYINSMKKHYRKQYGGAENEPQGASSSGLGEQIALIIYSSVSLFCGFLFLAAISYIFVTGFYPVHELLQDNSVPGWKKGMGATGMISLNFVFPTLWAFIRLIRNGGVLPYQPMGTHIL